MFNSVVVNPKRKGIYIDLKTKHNCVCIDAGNIFLEFSRINQDTFQLIRSHLADSPSPHPVISWSGVLWTRQAALEANQSLIAYSQAISPTD